MRFVCDSCRAPYMISDEKVGAKGVKVRCKKCGFVILVRRPQDEPSPPAQSAPSDDVDATQVMMNPLAAMGETPPSGSPAPRAGNGSALFGGVEEDEIGAVFDQILTGGKSPLDSAFGDSSEDQESTRIVDAETMRRLTEESAPSKAEKAEPQKHEWFIAIDEKQVGPLGLDKVKEHWDRGEAGPDSLCWRAGFSDWMPLSEVTELTAVLAPQPRKPVIVAPAPVDQENESSGSHGQRADSPVLTPSAPREDGGWKPSAASALASLVKEEIEALAKPAPASQAPAASEPEPMQAKSAERPRGLLDIPSQEISVPQGLRTERDSGGNTPRAARSRPDVPSYVPAPAPKSSKALVYGGGGALFAVLLLIGAVVWMMFRQQEKLDEISRKPAEAPVTVARKDPLPPPAPAPVKQPEPVAAPVKAEEPAKATEPVKTAEAVAAPAKQEAAPKAEEPKKEPERAAEREPEKTRKSGSTSKRDTQAAPEPTKSAPEPARNVASSGGNDDDFESMFGGSKKAAPKAAEPAKSRSVYVPPAPGQVEVPERLGQSDIMQVVLQNKTALATCAQEQKKRDPSLSGKLVVRWTILTSGKTAKVTPQTAEFKSTYMATCVTGVIKQMHFPAHKVEGEPIDFPFSF